MQILYIEDNPYDADLLTRELGKTAPWLHFEVVKTKAEAMARLRNPKKLAHELILTDMRLPDGDGLDILDHVRRLNLPLAVVVITGSSDEQTVVTALHSGADDYVVKRDNYLGTLPIIIEQARHRFQAETTRLIRPVRVLYAEPSTIDVDLTRRHMTEFAPHIHLDFIHSSTEVFSRLTSSQSKDLYDVLLMDYRLPGSNAIEVLKELYQVHQLDIPIVLVTGGGSEEIVVQALRFGASDYLLKETNYLHRLPLVLENAFNRNLLSRERSALRESEARYRAVSELTSDFAYAFAVNPDHTLVSQWVTDAFQRITGYSLVELQAGHGLDRLIHPNDLEIALRQKHEVLSGKADVSEFRIITNSGETRWLSNCCRPIWDEKQNRVTKVYGAAHDVSERKRMEEERKLLEAQIRQAQKMEAVGTLAGGIAHDFNNILSAMVGYTELAKLLMENDSQANSHLQKVLHAAHRAKELVRQILAFSRQSELERRPINLQSIVEEALHLLRATLPTTIQIDQQLSAKEDVVLGDPTQIHQVLMNLCTNAEYSMREQGGTLEIRLTSMQITPDFLLANPAFRLRPYLHLTIRDTGIGMSQEVKDRIFEPFFTTKGVEGTGMGLSVVHGIVTSHEGIVRVESAPEKGTSFHIYLPCVTETTDPILSEQEPISRGTERILFVDDEEVLTHVGQELLTNLGYHVAVFTSSLEALEVVRNDPQAFDLVITDQTMPNLTGEGLTRELLRLRPDLPVILCSGFSYAMTKEKLKEIGIRAYHMKPLEFRELALTVRRVLDQKS